MRPQPSPRTQNPVNLTRLTRTYMNRTGQSRGEVGLIWKERPLVNHYGRTAQNHWAQHAPQQLQAIEEPERFFTEMGEEIATQISELTAHLETIPSLSVETAGSLGDNGGSYVDQVASKMTARRIAEEVVMNQMVWIRDPSLSLPEARQEWEETRAADENLISWAERIQDSPYPVHSTVELEQKAMDWAVPLWFLEGLLAAEIPAQYAREHQQVLTEAANHRFQREIR